MPAYKNEYEIEQAIPVTFSDSQTLHCPFYPFEGDIIYQAFDGLVLANSPDFHPLDHVPAETLSRHPPIGIIEEFRDYHLRRSVISTFTDEMLYIRICCDDREY